MNYDPGSPAGAMLIKTLEAMYWGEIHDHRQGGFFRYCEHKDWTFPHHEKMLESNAGMLKNYLRAYRETGKNLFRNGARSVLRYSYTNLYDSATGTFGGSQTSPFNGREIYADFTPFTNWNSMIASALLTAYDLFHDREHLEKSLRILDFFGINAFDLAEV